MMHVLTKHRFRFMFDFLFRRSAKRKDPPAPEVPQASERAAQKEEARLAALRQADALAGDEHAALAFLLACPFADARLKAAENIHSLQALEQARDAMRNVDRRVAKLMQTRLDSIRKLNERNQAADARIAAARRLAQESLLTPSQAADLDRDWQSLGEVPAELQAAFDAARQEISERLTSQTTLQRAVMDALVRIRQIAESPDSLAPDELAGTLDALASQIAECVTSRELPSLPRNLLPAFEQEFQRLKQIQQEYELRRQAVAERMGVLAGWENAAAEALDPEEIEKQWRALPRPADADMAPLQARFEVLLRRIPRREKAQQPRRETQTGRESSETSAAFADLLDAMENALREGALQLAAEHDEKLRSLAQHSGRLDTGLAERLNLVRGELKRLQDWAKWSGRVSREELIRSVEGLPSLSLSLDDLANRVTEARKNWKSLDAASGAAPRALWEQFDAACNRAYAPVAEHGRKLADERARNAEAAQALIAQVREFAAGANLDHSGDAAGTDWKSVSSFYRRAHQSWRQIGTIERKERKRLDAEFEQAVAIIRQPLERQWQAETARREQLIEKVRALEPSSRGAADAVKRLQEQWQESARSLPLGSSEEQNLWKRFRAACDDMFAQRRTAAEAAGDTLRQNLQAREALCARLEAALDMPAHAISGLLQESAAEWSASGPVPKASETMIQARYRAAVSALQTKIDAAANEARQANHQVLIEKLKLCQAAESALAAKGKQDEAAWNRRWQAMPQLIAKQEAMLRSRFDAALAALNASDSLYAAMLEANRPQLLDELLRLEILLGMESPPEFSHERLKLQMEALQDSLAGNKEAARKARFDILCSLPALADEQASGRMAAILRFAGG